MIKLGLLLILFLIYVVFIAVAQFFKILAGGLNIAANSIQNFGNTTNQRIEDKVNYISSKLKYFFADSVKMTDEYANNDYEINDKNTKLSQKTLFITTLITIELYFFLMGPMIVSIAGYNQKLFLVCVSIAVEELKDYINKKAEKYNFIFNTSEEELAKIYFSRLDMYGAIAEQYKESSGMAALVLQHNLLFKIIEKDMQLSNLMDINVVQLSKKEEIDSEKELQYSHNIDSINYHKLSQTIEYKLKNLF